MRPPMKRSISGRIAELENIHDAPAVTFETLADIAVDTGYDALELRPWQLAFDATGEEASSVRAVLDTRGLRASMVALSGCFQPDRADLDAAQRAFARDVEMADRVGAELIRVTVNTEEDIAWVRRGADEAAERGIRLVHETHTNSPFETVAQCVDMVCRIDRDNFGILVDPVNLVLCGEGYGPDDLAPLAGRVFNVYVQNIRLNEKGSLPAPTRSGTVRYDRLVIGDAGGIDLELYFAALRSIGYDGYVTSHQPLLPDVTVRDLAQRVFRELSHG